MKREIRFRGKRLDNGEWIYGSLVINNNRYFIFNEDELHKEVDPSTVGQYVGLKDKNGVEIYEGDIVSWIRKNMNAFGTHFHKQDLIQICRVCYDEKGFRFMQEGKFSTGGGFAGPLDFNDDRAEECTVEVIDNIYNNPEIKIN